MPGVYTVTQMNSYIKNMFRQDFVLSRISVKGEVSNCKYHTSGHIYFSLKDGQGVMVGIEDTIKGFRMILDGEVDNLPEQAFLNVGTIEEAIEKGKKLLEQAKK